MGAIPNCSESRFARFLQSSRTREVRLFSLSLNFVLTFSGIANFWWRNWRSVFSSLCETARTKAFASPSHFPGMIVFFLIQTYENLTQMHKTLEYWRVVHLVLNFYSSTLNEKTNNSNLGNGIIRLVFVIFCSVISVQVPGCVSDFHVEKCYQKPAHSIRFSQFLGNASDFIYRLSFIYPASVI